VCDLLIFLHYTSCAQSSFLCSAPPGLVVRRDERVGRTCHSSTSVSVFMYTFLTLHKLCTELFCCCSAPGSTLPLNPFVLPPQASLYGATKESGARITRLPPFVDSWIRSSSRTFTLHKLRTELFCCRSATGLTRV